MVILTDGVSTYPKICEAPNQWNEARYQVFKYLPNCLISATVTYRIQIQTHITSNPLAYLS